MTVVSRLAFAAFLLVAPSVSAQRPEATARLDAAAWREDLHTLASELPRRHRNAFARMSRQAWDSAVADLDARIPRLRDYEIKVAFARLVALVHDGHTTLAPDGEPRMGFGRLPIELYEFSDGVYVVAADSTHANLVGARVTGIGSASIATAMNSAATIVSHEGPQWVRFRAPSLLVVPEVLAALHLGDSAQAVFHFVSNGQPLSATLRSTRRAMNVLTFGGSLPPGWKSMADGASRRPLWTQHPDTMMWFTTLPDRTLYIVSRAIVPFENGLTNEAFFKRAFAAGDSAGVTRVVIDIRGNGGGNNFMNKFLVRELVRHPALDQNTNAFIIIGRNTFSAAQSLVNELSYYTNATFVGEPTGNAPNQYGDARAFELPRSHLPVRISSLLWESHAAGDERTSFPPAVFAELSSEDFRAGRDPMFDAVVQYAGEGPLVDSLHAFVMRGDSAGVLGYLQKLRANPRNRYRPIEQEVNAAGYSLLRAERTAAAVIVLRANTELFPTSGNTYDSLGEALETSGDKAAAIVAYRRALALDANLFSSRDALRRLGATPNG